MGRRLNATDIRRFLFSSQRIAYREQVTPTNTDGTTVLYSIIVYAHEILMTAHVKGMGIVGRDDPAASSNCVGLVKPYSCASRGESQVTDT